MTIKYVIILISWFAVGLVSMILAFAIDLRGKPYDDSYFNNIMFPAIVVLAAGYISPILLLLAYEDKKKFLRKLIYRIVNIGIDKDKIEIR